MVSLLLPNRPQIVMGLSESEYTLAMWPHNFRLTYTVALKDDRLATEFCVMNTGDKALDFTAALHSYWSISSVKNIKISSAAFNGATYLDKMQTPPKDMSSTSSDIVIKSEVDQVYADVSGDIVLSDSARKAPLTISNQLGWSDTVLWNPYGNEDMGYDSFVCVESAQASKPVILQAGEYWTGAMDVCP